MKAKDNNLKSLDQFIDEKVDNKGSTNRDTFEADYETFKLGVLIQQAREEKGLTQEQIAELGGIRKPYIYQSQIHLKECIRIAEKHELSKMTIEEINAEIRAVRNVASNS